MSIIYNHKNNHMRIILLGAQGTGKTTLANAFQKKWQCPVFESASRYIYEMIENGELKISLAEYHKVITKMNVKIWKETKDLSKSSMCLFARTPIDNIAYDPEIKTIKDIRSSELYNILKDGIGDCLIVRLMIEFPIENDGVRSQDKQYQEEIQNKQGLVLDALIEDGLIDKSNIINVSGSVEKRLAEIEEALHLADQISWKIYKECSFILKYVIDDKMLTAEEREVLKKAMKKGTEINKVNELIRKVVSIYRNEIPIIKTTTDSQIVKIECD